MSAGTVRLGRGVTVVGLPALVVLTAGWLFLGAGPVRTAVTWVALAALAGCILAITGYVLRAGRVTPRRAYELALEAERTPAAGAGSAVPGALHGSRWTWARITAVALAVPTALVLFGSLGAATPDRSPTAGRIAGAGYVIEELPVVAVRNAERAGSSSRASSVADYTVRLPAAHGGKGVLATFRTEVHRGVGQVGDTFPVAHTPGRPELGAVGATARSEVEAQLIGRTLPHSSFLIVAALWVILAMAMLFVGTAIAAAPRRAARRVDASWVALRATATGVAEHVEQPSGDDTGPGDDKQDGKPDDKAGATTSAKKSTARYQCLILRTEAGDVPLNLAASHKRAAPLLIGTEGWLLWKPTGSKGKAPADFVADDGWQLPGRVPGAEAARIAAARKREPFPVDAGRRTRLLELGSHWPRTVPISVLLGMILSVAVAGTLLLPVDGGWRLWTAAAGALAPLLVWMTGGLFAAPAAETKAAQAEVQAGGGPAA
ncbi:hypothetical protein DY245_07190 [Streptomyces inhibens]|uniref:DUF3592 domain-containing protein n=1 Tax=Streptomyces inhibens TaxID=2293571 RepID=A0A371Q8E9_STRIH|nr:hypothetical protein [Streptomyces inhibens]REK90961.1 hypothetical protein DY245_07190 [Streptomyces inhibens]